MSITTSAINYHHVGRVEVDTDYQICRREPGYPNGLRATKIRFYDEADCLVHEITAFGADDAAPHVEVIR